MAFEIAGSRPQNLGKCRGRMVARVKAAKGAVPVASIAIFSHGGSEGSADRVLHSTCRALRRSAAAGEAETAAASAADDEVGTADGSGRGDRYSAESSGIAKTDAMVVMGCESR